MRLSPPVGWQAAEGWQRTNLTLPSLIRRHDPDGKTLGLTAGYDPRDC